MATAGAAESLPWAEILRPMIRELLARTPLEGPRREAAVAELRRRLAIVLPAADVEALFQEPTTPGEGPVFGGDDPKVTFHIIDRGGFPVLGAIVSLVLAEGFAPEVVGTTDAGGNVAFDLNPGDYRFHARKGTAFADFVYKVGTADASETVEIGIQPSFVDTLLAVFRPAVEGLLERFVGPERMANVDREGDFFSWLGSLQDILVDENRLTSGPFTFADALRYENHISGIQVAMILVSFVFSMTVEVLSLGQVDAFTGLLIHMMDSTVGDVAKVVSTQLVRRAVGGPLEAGYARIHRFKELSTSEAEEAFALGLLDVTTYVDILVADSFTDRAIQQKVQLARVRAFNEAGVFPIRAKFLPPSTLLEAYGKGVVDDRELLTELARQGYDDVALDVYHVLAQLRVKLPPPEGG